MNTSLWMLAGIPLLAASGFAAPQIELRKCHPQQPLTVQRTEIRLTEIEVGHKVIAELVPGSVTEVEVRWRNRDQITCADMIAGSEFDVLAAEPLIEEAIRRRREDAGIALFRILRPQRRSAELYSISLAKADCSLVKKLEVALLSGLNKRFQNQLEQSLACFERARSISAGSLHALFAAALLSGLAQRPEREVGERYSELGNMHLAFQARSAFEKARLPQFYGRPQEAIKRLVEYVKQDWAASFVERAAKSLSELALIEGEVDDARLGQEAVVDQLLRIAPADSRIGSDFRYSFAFERLGLLREVSNDLVGALEAYTLASESTDNSMYRFEPRLGLLRVLKKLERFGKSEERECSSWRTTIRRPEFRISDKSSGGLLLAMARIEFSCGSVSSGIDLIRRVIEERPEWDQPLLVLADHLVSAGRWISAQNFRRAAARLKQRSDSSDIRKMLSDIEGSAIIQRE